MACQRQTVPNQPDTGSIEMANSIPITTRAREHHVTIRRQALEALGATLAKRELLQALAEAIEVLDEHTSAYEVCVTAFVKHAHGGVL